MSAEADRLVLDAVTQRYDAALCEAGYPGAARPAVFSAELARVVVRYRPHAVPPAVRWRAREAIGLNAPRCWACWSVATYDYVTPCLADRRFIEDCGTAS